MGDKIVFYISFPDEVCVLLNRDERGIKRCGAGILEIDLDVVGSGKLHYEVQRVNKTKICEGNLSIPSGSLRFAVIGDTSYKTGFLKKLVDKILNFSPDMVFHVGDFQYETRKDRWSRLLKIFQPLFSDSFFFISPGNHEYESYEDIVKLNKYFPYEGFFRFEWGEVAFVGINLEVERDRWETKLKEYIGLAKQKNFPVILFVHRPVFSLSKWSALELRQDLFRAIYPYAKVVFAGHNHIYGRVQINELSQITSGGGGATLYGCARREGEFIREYDGLGEVKIKIIKCVEDFNTVLCELNRNLSCRAVSPTRGVIDDFSVEFIDDFSVEFK